MVKSVVKEREEGSAIGDSDSRRMGTAENSDGEIIALTHWTGECGAVVVNRKVARLYCQT